MKKIIALGTAVLMLAVSFAIVRAAEEEGKTKIGVAFAVSSGDIGVGTTVSVTVSALNAGGTEANFRVESIGADKTDQAIAVGFVNAGNSDGEFSVTKKGNALFRVKDVLCVIIFTVTDPTSAEIKIVPDGDSTVIGTNASWKAAAAEGSKPSGSVSSSEPKPTESSKPSGSASSSKPKPTESSKPSSSASSSESKPTESSKPSSSASSSKPRPTESSKPSGSASSSESKPTESSKPSDSASSSESKPAESSGPSVSASSGESIPNEASEPSGDWSGGNYGLDGVSDSDGIEPNITVIYLGIMVVLVVLAAAGIVMANKKK